MTHKRTIPNYSAPINPRRGMPSMKNVPIQTLQDLQQLIQEKIMQTENTERKRLANEAQKRKEKENEERKRFAAVKQGNLLGLNTPPEKNLLSFEVTKEALNDRLSELSEINFGKGGKRKTRRSRKSKKTRKAKRT